MADFHFLRPEYLLGFLPILCLVYLFCLKHSGVNQPGFIDAHLLQHLLLKRKNKRGLSPLAVLACVWSLSVLALSGPTWQLQPTPFAEDQAGLMIVLKVDETMLASDVPPNRLERAKQKVGDLISLRQGARTGLIVYQGSAHLVMPLTTDSRIISLMLEDLMPEHLPKEGDDLLGAIQLAEATLNQANISGSILVIADQAQISDLAKDNATPIQFLAMQTPAQDTQSGLLAVSQALDAPVSSVTIDNTDIQQIQTRARRQYNQTAGEGEGQYWQDMGHWLLWPIVFLHLLWFRKGWAVR